MIYFESAFGDFPAYTHLQNKTSLADYNYSYTSIVGEFRATSRRERDGKGRDFFTGRFRERRMERRSRPRPVEISTSMFPSRQTQIPVPAPPHSITSPARPVPYRQSIKPSLSRPVAVYLRPAFVPYCYKNDPLTRNLRTRI